MAEVSWIKLRIDMFDDEKIQIIQGMPEGVGDAILVIWVRLLALAGKTNDEGQIYVDTDIPYTDQILATLFKKPLTTVKLALETLQKFRMIDIFDNGVILVTNFEKHQNAEALDKIRDQNRIRQQARRDRLKLLKTSNSNNKDLDKDKEEDIERMRDVTQTSRKSNAKLEGNFNELWSLYPKKQGKSAAFKAYHKAIKAGVTDELISQKINDYLKYLEANKDWLKPANGSTWFNQERWNDDYSSNQANDKPTNREDVPF